MVDLDPNLCNGEFLLLEDCVETLNGVNVKEIQEKRNAEINGKFPGLVKSQNIRNNIFPILCIKLIMKDGSIFVFIPYQTIIPYPIKNKLYIHKIGQMGESQLNDYVGRLLLPDWCLHWQAELKRYDLHFNMTLEYRHEHPNQQNDINNVLHLIREIKVVDQNPDRIAYRLLLPPVSVILEGNPPQQLRNQTLFAQFPKGAVSEIINLPFLDDQQIQDIHGHASQELLDIKQGAVELSAEIFLIPQNVVRNKDDVTIRSIRKSLSASSPFPHLFSPLESGDQEADIIVLQIESGKIQCRFTYIPKQVIIIDKTNQLLIFYLGLLTEIHLDTQENMLHLPGISILVEAESEYAFEIDVKLKYSPENQGKLQVIVKENAAPAALSNERYVSLLPSGGLPIKGRLPHRLGSRTLKVKFDNTGQLRFHPDCTAEGLILRFPRTSLQIKTQLPQMQCSSGSGSASGTQNLPIHQVVPQTCMKNVFSNRGLAHGRFLLPPDRYIPKKSINFYMWNLIPGRKHVEKISPKHHPELCRRICIQLTFNDGSTCVYFPRQHIVYFNKKEWLWLFEHCNLFANNEGNHIFAWETVKQFGAYMEIDLNAHYQFNENGENKKLEENSIHSYGFNDNIYLTPPPFAPDYISGCTPKGVSIQQLTVCFPIRSQLVEIDQQSIPGNELPSLGTTAPDLRANCSTKKAKSSLAEMATQMAIQMSTLGRELQPRPYVRPSRMRNPFLASIGRNPTASLPDTRQFSTYIPRARFPNISGFTPNHSVFLFRRVAPTMLQQAHSVIPPTSCNPHSPKFCMTQPHNSPVKLYK